ncbi:hypothetical protein IGI04_039618 [Brassica rapa subsp. trilocularis]|uniref:Uncharacterized protein n=1 Tax=Brassica rapa subsp. trilocularis TaxID=1813537 RepID=A0ABQ7KKD5_BRACM|nr:hypothetical protein IGI04_039618 [Brassica rapa subsp. trilocularis]
MGDSQRRKKKGDYNSRNHDETRILVQLLVEAVNNNWRDSSGSFSKLTVESKILPELNKDVYRAKYFKHYQSRHKQGVATGKNAVGLGDGTDARTYKAGENSNEENWNDVDNIYEFNASTRDHELSEQYAPFDSQTVPESRTEKFQPRKRARSERGVSQKDENPAMAVSTQILNIIQQREERQQKETSERKINV